MKEDKLLDNIFKSIVSLRKEMKTTLLSDLPIPNKKAEKTVRDYMCERIENYFSGKIDEILSFDIMCGRKSRRNKSP